MRWTRTFTALAALSIIGCGGAQAPEVGISLPADGATVSGITTVLVIAEDDEEVDSVTLFIDDSLVSGYGERPFLYSWNTHALGDSTGHYLYARAGDHDGNEGVSDTVSVTVFNGSLLLGDDFESYAPGLHPVPVWREIWPGVGESTYVSQAIANQGVKSLRSFGYAAYVRTDGVNIDTAGAVRMAYEVSVFIPDESANGALVGLFHRIDPNTGEIYNGVMFSPDSHQVHVRGLSPVVTPFIWEHETWYDVRVELDFALSSMDVWIDTCRVAENIETSYSMLTDTFALSTIFGYDGDVYYDDVRVRRGE